MAAVDFLTDYQITDKSNVLEIRTDNLVPISSDVPNRRYLFTLLPQGKMDSNSLLQFKLKQDTGTKELRVNCFNGALGAIKRAVFRIGDFELNNTDDVNVWSTQVNLMKKRRIALNRYHSYYLGNQMHSLMSNEADSTHGQYQVDDDLSGYNFTDRVANSYLISSNEADCYKYGIPLGLLIPALKGQQIPLYMMSQYKINIEVEFHLPSVYCNRNTTTGCAVASDTDVEITQVELLIDHLIYPSNYLQAEQAQIAKEGGYQFEFLNVTTVERQLEVTKSVVNTVNTAELYTANGPLQSLETVKEFRLGQEGREVHQIYMNKKRQNRDSSLYGPVASSTVKEAGTGYTHSVVTSTIATSGNGKGLTVNFTVTGGGATGPIDVITVVDPGSGYKATDTIAVVGGNSDGVISVTTIGETNEASLMLGQRSDGIASESVQWKVNGINVYPDPKTLTASQYDAFTYANKNIDLQLERPCFYTDANSISGITTAGDSGLQGTYKPIALDLTTGPGIVGAGTGIGRYPIVLQYKATPAMALSNFGVGGTGGFSCSGQDGTYDVDFIVTSSRVATVQSGPKGMTVSVSM
jgi:hypothetical protein